jgi:1-acyl-sn-glycerol-3-phosphate acyltransferase
MGDFYYNVVWYTFNHAFWASSRPIVIGRENTRREGAFIIAANHESPYDVALMIRHAVRKLDFVTVTEAFRNPLVKWFYTGMNTIPLDRSRPDAPALRKILERLKRGRAVAIFPEGRLRLGEDSMLHTRKMRPGLGRLAHMANAPIVPCVVIKSNLYSKPTSWLPLKRTRYGIIYGEPIAPQANPAETEKLFIDRMVALRDELVAKMPKNS